jgi:uncharacterized RDD family membrane protein YckC
MDREHYTVPGAAGVELDLPLAGPGSRSYAFVIDWHIRLLLALAWLVIGMLAANGGLRWTAPGTKPTVVFGFLVALPAAIIYFLYHPVVELWMRGQTPGKRMAGVRIVNSQGGIPSAGAIVIRNVFRLIDSLPAFYCVGLVSTFFTAQRVRIGDMAAGTFLMVDEPIASGAFTPYVGVAGSVDRDLQGIEVARQILDRWQGLEPGRRRGLARALLKRIEAVEAESLDTMSDEDLRVKLTQAAMAGNAP